MDTGVRPIPHFQVELSVLKTRLLVMGGLAEDALRRAVDGLAGRDPGALDAVLGADLQVILAAVNINTALDRVGDHATNVAGDVIFMVSALDIRHSYPG